MRALVKEPGFVVLHLLHRGDAFRAPLRVTLKIADGVEQIGRVRTAVRIDRQRLPFFLVRASVAGICARAQLVFPDAPADFRHDRVDVHRFRLPLFLGIKLISRMLFPEDHNKSDLACQKDSHFHFVKLAKKLLQSPAFLL